MATLEMPRSPAPSLVNSEVNHLVVEVEYEGLLVESPSTSGVSGWVDNLVVVIQPNMFVFLRPLASARVRFFVIDGLRAVFLLVHVMVSAHWFPLLEFLCGAHMVSAAGETVYVLLVLFVLARVSLALCVLRWEGLSMVFFFREGFSPVVFRILVPPCVPQLVPHVLQRPHCTSRSWYAEAQQLHGSLCLVCALYFFDSWSAGYASWKDLCVLQS